MAKVVATPTRLWHPTTATAGRHNGRPSRVCAKGVKSTHENSGATSSDRVDFGSGRMPSGTDDMYKNMVPLDGKKKNKDGPDLHLFEVHDADTQETLDNLFYSSEDEEPEHGSCMRTSTGTVVCGEDSTLLEVAAPAAIHAGGTFYATSHSEGPPEDPEVTVDVSD